MIVGKQPQLMKIFNTDESDRKYFYNYYSKYLQTVILL